jgi:2-dehydro-3-deoxygalactonokinase
VPGLVAVDWGTSSLRGARLDDAGTVREEREFARGIMTVAAGAFRPVFDECFGDWLHDSPLALISGMAGSRQGWVEAPYCNCPAGFADIAGRLAWVEPGRIAIVPGLACDRDGTPDVMRGEETQVVGAMQLLGLRDATLVLPGTHSKWVRVEGGRIRAFSTFMTGEFYGLLRKHSILARGMPEGDDAFDAEAFQRGLRHARLSRSILQAAFSARTLALFDRMPAGALPSYLSGLVIGDELRSQDVLAAEVILVGNPNLAQRYALALKASGVRSTPAVGAEAAWRGLHAIAQSIA